MRAQITELCTVAESLEGIEFRGLMGYDGGAVPTAQDSADRLHAARDAVEATGLTVGLISGAGSENYVGLRTGHSAHLHAAAAGSLTSIAISGLRRCWTTVARRGRCRAAAASSAARSTVSRGLTCLDL